MLKPVAGMKLFPIRYLCTASHSTRIEHMFSAPAMCLVIVHRRFAIYSSCHACVGSVKCTLQSECMECGIVRDDTEAPINTGTRLNRWLEICSVTCCELPVVKIWNLQFSFQRDDVLVEDLSPGTEHDTVGRFEPQTSAPCADLV